MTAAFASIETGERRELDDLTLARAQQGDASAFRVLVETYQDRVFALLWRFLGRNAHRAAIEDTAQTTFLGVYRALPRFSAHGTARLSTWILTIAARAAFKAHRDHARTLVPDDDGQEMQSAEAPHRGADNRAFVDALGRALEVLPPGYRAVFLLRAYHELDYHEIATALDIDIGTVKSRLSRARSRLRDALKEFAP